MESTESTRYIFLNSLFDERKCSHRFSYELKCFFQNKSKLLERPDYYGTGEAEGDFCQISMDSLREDIVSFCSYDNCIVIGLRFGAALVLDYLKCSPQNISNVILIDPVCDLNKYVEHLFRKQRIKDIMTGFQDEILRDDDYVNIEGYKTQKYFLEQLAGYGTVDFGVCKKYKMSIITNDNLFNSGIDADVSIIKYGPFWERIPPQDNNQLIEKVLKEISLI